MRWPPARRSSLQQLDLPSRTSFLPVVNALLLGSLLYRSRLVARTIPLVGLIGAPLLLISDLGVLFGLWPQVSALTAISALPIALWEFSLDVWLVVKGFKPSPHRWNGPRRSPARR